MVFFYAKIDRDKFINKFDRGDKMKYLVLVVGVVFCFCLCASRQTEPLSRENWNFGKDASQTEVGKMVLRSATFAPGQTLPKRFTGDGDDVSPELNWDNVPDRTKSFALVCSDPDAPVGTFIHWVIYNIPGAVRQLAEGVAKEAKLPDGSTQGINGFRQIGYNGPRPPPGKPHRYFFRLYALDTVFGLPAGLSTKELEEAIAGHILAAAELMGRYGR